METLQEPFSDNHTSAMFFNGMIARDGDYTLETYQDGEICYEDDLYIGEATTDLVNHIDDEDIDNEEIVEIYVDKFFTINYKGNPIDDENLIFDTYHDAIEEFESYLVTKQN